MPYSRQTWNDNDPTTPIDGVRLTYIETGIQTAQAGVDTLNAAQALLAPLASPEFTGNPTVPTQTALTNNSRAASTAYADAAVAVAARAETAEAALGSAVTPSTPNAALVVNSGGTDWAEQLLTALNFASSVFATGTESSIPAATTVPSGSRYYATDTHVELQSNGTVWIPLSWPGGRGTLSGAQANIDLDQVSSSSIALAGSGSDTLVGIFLPLGFVVSTIAWRVGNTSATLGTNSDSHWYFVIRSQSGALEASTADQTTAAISSSTTHPLAIARDASNSTVTSWTSPASDTYLVGPNIYIGTGGSPIMPTSVGDGTALVSTSVNGLRKIISATGQTGMTSGIPATTSSPANATIQPFVMVY